MTVTVYGAGCLPCTNKQLWKQLKAKAAEKRLLLQRKDVRKDPVAKDEANNTYGMPTPFIVNEKGVALTVAEFLNG